MWWVRDADIPPLAATGPVGAPGTAVLLNDSDTFDNQLRHGSRLTVGRWLNPAQTAGLEATYLWLANRNPSYRVSDSGDPLGVPFIDSATGLESLESVSGAGQGGRIDIDTEFAFWAAEANLRKELCRGGCYHLDLLIGSRYLSLQEGLDVTTSTTFTDGAAQGSSLSRSDRFGTRNSIWGGQVGAEFEFNYKRLFADVWGKVLLGGNHQVVNIGGTSLLTGPTRGTQAAAGGLFAQRSNIGHHTRDEFVIVPEVGVNVGYCLTDWLRLTAGYNFLFISDAVRPGDQIDRTVNTGFQLSASGAATPDLGGGPLPAFAFRDTEFWAHGLSVGLEFRY
jgi:hypothetical protein